MATPGKLLIIGCGDIGRRTARLALDSGWQVTGLVRSAESAEKLAGLPVQVLEANLLDESALAAIEFRSCTILYLAPPPGGGTSDPKVRNLCAAIRPGDEPDKIVYISTSGVYGDCRGERVNEATAPNPQTTRARRRMDAEAGFRQFSAQRQVPLVILRVTGIYGPHRFPLHRILERHPILHESEAPMTNRIHADDLARVCLRAVEKGRGGDIFNVSDGQERSMSEYFNLLADTFGLPRPPQISLAEAQHSMAPLMLSYFQESRRMDNRKLLEQLQLSLLYPTLEAGLGASYQEMLRDNPDFLREVLGRD